LFFTNRRNRHWKVSKVNVSLREAHLSNSLKNKDAKLSLSTPRPYMRGSKSITSRCKYIYLKEYVSTENLKNPDLKNHSDKVFRLNQFTEILRERILVDLRLKVVLQLHQSYV
jgi:hypothetical protein